MRSLIYLFNSYIWPETDQITTFTLKFRTAHHQIQYDKDSYKLRNKISLFFDPCLISILLV